MPGAARGPGPAHAAAGALSSRPCAGLFVCWPWQALLASGLLAVMALIGYLSTRMLLRELSPSPLLGCEVAGRNSSFHPEKHRGQLRLETGDSFKELVRRHLHYRSASNRGQNDMDDVWDDPDISLSHFKNGIPIPLQTRLRCKSLLLAAQSITGRGVIVELGTSIGHSTRCLAAGLRKSNKHNQSRIYSFGTLSTLQPWECNVRALDPSASAISGRLAQVVTPAAWRHQPIELLILHAPTKLPELRALLVGVGELAVGSIISIMHFAQTALVDVDPLEIFLLMFTPTKELEVVALDFCSLAWTFVVRKPLSLANLVIYDPIAIPKNQWETIYDSARSIIISLATEMGASSSMSTCTLELIQARLAVAMSGSFEPTHNTMLLRIQEKHNYSSEQQGIAQDLSLYCEDSNPSQSHQYHKDHHASRLSNTQKLEQALEQLPFTVTLLPMPGKPEVKVQAVEGPQQVVWQDSISIS
eukprot:SM000104S09326  [mRNA]  locus=s104:153511:156602:+ [translate_table: standard]